MGDSGNGRVNENFNGGIFDGYREDVAYPGDRSLTDALDAAEHGTSMESLLPSEDREALAIGRSVLTVAKALGGLLRVVSAAGNEAVRDVNQRGLRGAVAQSLRRAAMNIDRTPPVGDFVAPSWVGSDVSPSTAMPIDDYDPSSFEPDADMSEDAIRRMEEQMLEQAEAEARRRAQAYTQFRPRAVYRRHHFAPVADFREVNVEPRVRIASEGRQAIHNASKRAFDINDAPHMIDELMDGIDDEIEAIEGRAPGDDSPLREEEIRDDELPDDELEATP